LIYFLGDVHGHFEHILPAIQGDDPHDGKPKTVIFLGDIQAQRPFEEEIQPLIAAGIEVWFIHGNRDTDTAAEWQNLLPSWHRNLHGRVVTIDGLRIAGLGGTFREKIWLPPAPPMFHGYQYFDEDVRRCSMPRPALDQLLLRYSSAIFPDVYEDLAQRPADILVTHEAPSCHPNGFEAIDILARGMSVQATFHGHHHDSLNYEAKADARGFRAYGVGFCGITDQFGGRILAGDFDEGRRYREGRV
jgi:predicted phosphodiesterase